jgi:2,5-furandicarboxylate decarboxylase 1
MSFESLRDFITFLENHGDLIRIKEELSTRHEIPAAMRYMDQRRGDAIMFDNVKGYDVPIIGNLLGRRNRLRVALAAKGDLTAHYLKKTKNPVKTILAEGGPIKEHVLKGHIDILETMPVLVHHEKDASPYFTCAVTIAKDPDTGVPGMGIHRIQVKGKNRVGILLFSPPLSHFFKRYEERGEPMEIAVVVGMDPITFFSSVIWAPKGINKFELAGALKGSPVKMVKCETVDLEVPAEAEFVLEGKVLPHIREPEGPFGESTGVYLSYDNPVAEIDVITHREKPIYQALMPLTMEGHVLVGISWEAENLKAIQKKFPQVIRAHISPLEFGQLIVQIDKQSEEDPKRVIDYTLALNPYTKSVVIVDADIDLYDPKEVAWAISNRFQPDRDLVIKEGVPGSVIDPSAAKDFKTSKIGYDATKPLGKDEKFEKISIPADIRSKIKGIVDGYLA